MSELRYKLHEGTPYLTGLENKDKDTLKIIVDGAKSGYMRIGELSVRFEGGEASLPIRKIGYGAARVELVTASERIKLFPIERGLSGADPIIDREELCNIYRTLLSAKEELTALKRDVNALNEAVFKSTIL